MSLKQYLITMILGTLACWASFVLVLFNIDPFHSDTVGFAMFYLSLFLALVGTSSLVVTLLYRLLSRGHVPMYRHVELGFKRGAIIAFALIVLLYLQGAGWLNFVNSTILALAVIFLALLVVSSKKKPNQSPNFQDLDV